MWVLYNFEKAFNEIKGLSVEGNKKEYVEFLESIRPFLEHGIYVYNTLHPVLWVIYDSDKHTSINKWYYYQCDYHLTKLVLKGSKYDEEFDFTELFEDLVGAI